MHVIDLYREVAALQRKSAMFYSYVSAIWPREAGCFREVAALYSGSLRQVSL